MMKYQSFKWTEFCPSLYERGEMVTVGDVPAMREKYGKENPMFISRFLFNKASPYTGKVLSNFYADFDDGEDPWRALVEMLDMAEQFIEMGVDEDHIKLRFTGGKGGTVEVPYQYFEAEPRDDLPQIWRAVAEWFSKNWNYKTLDESVYERRRLWRLTNTRHKSGRFKIPITVQELKDNKLEGIKELAKEFRPYTWVDDRTVEVTAIPKLIGLYKDARKEVGKAKRKWYKNLTERVYSDGRIFPCIEQLIKNGVDADEFQRNPTAFNIAVALQSLGVDDVQILEYLEEFAGNCTPAFPLDRYPELQHCIDSASKHEYTTHCGTPCFESACVKKKNCWVFQTQDEEEAVVIEEFSPEIHERAEALLNGNDPLGFVDKYALSGVFMERNTKLTLFLLQLAWESARLSGETSTGKSHIADHVMECFPKHWWMKYTGATDKYIRYLPSSIRTIYFAEFAAVKIGAGEETTAEYDMKMIMSEGELKTGVVEKVDGRLTGTIREVRIQNFITTSTDVKMSPELRNRQWELSTDRNINLPFIKHHMKEQSRPPWERINPKESQRVVRCALEKLDEEAPTVWWVPFASELAAIFKPLEARTDSRRSVQKLLKLIKAMAKLHYRNRPIIDHEGTKYGIAMPEDFYEAWQIGDEAIMGTLTEMTKRVEVVWECVVSITKAKKKLNSQTLSSAAGVNQDSAKKWLNRFQDMGLVSAVDRDAAGVQYRRTEASSEDAAEEKSSVEISISSLYESLTSVVSAEYIEASKARVADKKIVLEYPSTVRRFSIDDLPDDLKVMANGSTIDIYRMGGDRLIALRGMDELRMGYEARMEAGYDFVRDNIPDDYVHIEDCTLDEDIPDVIEDGIYDEAVWKRIKVLYDGWCSDGRKKFHEHLAEGLE